MKSSLFFVLLAGSALADAQMTFVNGASFNAAQPMAPASFATVFGNHLCSQTAQGGWIAPGQLPTTLAGCSMTVDGMAAMLQYVSPGQVNFIVPAQAGPGMASVVFNDGGQIFNGSMNVGMAGPGVFGLNGMGMGDGAMLHGSLWREGPFSATTNGNPTPISVFMTGLDLSAKPVVSIGGVPVEVTYAGVAPGFVGLQQINIMLPAGMAGVGRVPVTITSSGQVSNVTFMTMLPTTGMMQGMPGWGQGMMVAENMPRAREMSSVAMNPSNRTALVADQNDDAVRVLSLDTGLVMNTITLPQGSGAHSIAVNASGTLAAVALSARASLALINLAQNNSVSVIATGSYPTRVAFAGSSLLATNGASGTVSVIDTASQTVARTVTVGFGPAGIAASSALAVVANMQEGSLSVISLADYSVTKVALPAGSRPHEVTISSDGGQAIISMPMSNSLLILDLATKTITSADTGVWNAMGPGSLAVLNGLGFAANQMSAAVTVLDLSNGKIVKTFPVDPGPRSLVVDPVKNQLLVLCEGTGTLDVVDLNSYQILTRMNAGGSDRQGTWVMPLIASITPKSGQAGGPAFTFTINGSNLQSVRNVEFRGSGAGMMGGGMMGGGGSGQGDPNINVSNVQVNAAGIQITATVQILSSAVAGVRQVGLETDRGNVMGMMSGNTLFTVTK